MTIGLVRRTLRLYNNSPLCPKSTYLDANWYQATKKESYEITHSRSKIQIGYNFIDTVLFL